MAGVVFKNISKRFETGVYAVKDFDLEIKDKEFVVFVGPSGCGKSTTLRMIAGLETPTTGELYIGDRQVNNVPPKDRDIAMVFQNYALYPHMSVYENIAYGLRLRKFPQSVIDEKVMEAARILDLTGQLKRKPRMLSGGQRQRVAIGRAIVREPQVFLMDEPLSNLDAKLRNQMRAEILMLRKRIDTTFVYVTHDQTEAMTLGDRIVVMKAGVIQQVGSPQEVFAHPRNIFVAGFIGTPQMNFFEGELLKENGRFFVKLGNLSVVLSDDKQERLFKNDVQPQPVKVGVRPEHMLLSDCGIPASLGLLEMMGSSVNVHMKAMEQDVIAVVPAMDDDGHFRAGITEKEEFHLSFLGSAVHVFDAEKGLNLEFCENTPSCDEAPSAETVSDVINSDSEEKADIHPKEKEPKKHFRLFKK